jgi:hypothetical protein
MRAEAGVERRESTQVLVAFVPAAIGKIALEVGDCRLTTASGIRTRSPREPKQ